MSARLTLLLISGIWLSSCATQSLPSNFVYETSLRTEQGFIGSANRKASAEALLSGGVVSDPNISLQAALPDAEVKVRRWGLVYLSKNWKRYQAVLDADITQGDEKTKCRMSAPESLALSNKKAAIFIAANDKNLSYPSAPCRTQSGHVCEARRDGPTPETNIDLL